MYSGATMKKIMINSKSFFVNFSTKTIEFGESEPEKVWHKSRDDIGLNGGWDEMPVTQHNIGIIWA